MDPDRALGCQARVHQIWAFANDIIVDMKNCFIIASQWSNDLEDLHRNYKTEMSKQRKDMAKSSESKESEGLKEYFQHSAHDVAQQFKPTWSLNMAATWGSR
jgi:hypothetical protein